MLFLPLVQFLPTLGPDLLLLRRQLRLRLGPATPLLMFLFPRNGDVTRPAPVRLLVAWHSASPRKVRRICQALYLLFPIRITAFFIMWDNSYVLPNRARPFRPPLSAENRGMAL